MFVDGERITCNLKLAMFFRPGTAKGGRSGMTHPGRPGLIAATAFLATFWTGMLAGVSFWRRGEVPGGISVFTCSTGSRERSLLDIQQVEWGLAILLAAAAVFSNGSRLVLAGAVVVGAVVAIEAYGSFPVLDARQRRDHEHTAFALGSSHALRRRRRH